MSSGGQALGGVVGGVIGFFVGGPVGALRGAQIGIMAGGLIDPPKGPTINGPRLEDLNVQTSTYGAFIPRNYGTVAQSGNVFWILGDAITEVQTTISSGGKGGPEQTTNTWSYYATFAVGLCKGPIDGVRRIWIGGQLWYDAGSDDLSTIIASNQKSDLFTLYLGTDTQTADPLIQADKGVANVPAYRGLAYIVFDTLPLEKYGNSLMGAQVKCEIVKSQNDVASFALVTRSDTNMSSASGIIFTTASNEIDYAITAAFDSAAFGVPRVTQHGFSASVTTTITHTFDVGSDAMRAEGAALYIVQEYLVQYFRVGYSIDPLDYHRFRIDGYNPGSSSNWQAVLHDGQLFVTWAGGPNAGWIVKAAGPREDGIDAPQVTRSDLFFLSITLGDDCLIGITATDIYTLDLDTLATITSAPYTSQYTMSTFGVFIAWDLGKLWLLPRNADGGLTAYHGCLQSYDVVTGARIDLVRDIPYSGSTSSFGQPGIIRHGLLIHANKGDQEFHIIAFGVKSSNSETLGNIVEAECLTSKLLTAGDVDVTELTDEVRGYRVSQIGAIRGALDPLRAAWPFDVVQHGYQILFKRRGSASVAAIPYTLLDARAAGESPGVQITDSREMDLMLPRRVDVKYLDSVREYDINEQMSPERTSTDTAGIRKLDLPIVFTGAEAAQKAETLLYLYWLERYDVVLRLPPEYSELEPGDVITVTSDTADYELRLTSINTLPDGRMECAAKYNKAAIYTPVARGEEGQSTGGTLTLAGPAVYSLLDIPLLRDDDDTAGFPVAMAGYLSGWPGGILYRSDDGGQSWTDLRAFSPGAVIGYATTTLAAHGGTVIDFASTLTVRLYAGTLASVTQAQMFAGQNWFAYGAHGRWEIIATATAVLQGDGSYILSDFLRGQRGTEWATGLHETNDRIVLLDANSLAFISVNSSTIGASRDYRGITTGRALSTDVSQSFTYAGVNLECLSPVYLTGNRHPSTNDWTLTWTRRSRFDQWRDYVDAPLGETSESYEVDVYSNGTYATVVRTLTASSATVPYTSAQQVTDFGSNQSTLYLKVYQLSATVGRGYPLTQSITR